MTPHEALKHHVTGAIERGEKHAIVEQTQTISEQEEKGAQTMTHTPGPWKLGTSCDGFLTVTDGSKTICTVGAADLFPQIEIDATLIAAAPDLFEALKDIPMNCDHTYPHLFACWVCKAKAAIARAEGKSVTEGY